MITHRRLWRAGLAALCAAGLATPAHAGTYTVLSCHDRAGAAIGVSDHAGGWTYHADPAPSAGRSATNTCGSGGALGARVGGPTDLGPGLHASAWYFDTPLNTTIKHWKVDWEGYSAPGSEGRNTYATIFDAGEEFEKHPQAGAVARHWTEREVGERSEVVVQARCIEGFKTCGETTNATITLHRAEVVLTDAHAPSGSAGGTAIQKERWTAPLTATVDGADAGAGVRRYVVTLDGAEVAATVADANGGQCAFRNGEAQVYVTPRPCLLDPGARELQVDPRPRPDGPVLLRVLVEDAAGNVSTVFGPEERLLDTHAPVLDAPALSGSGREGEPLTCSAAVHGQDPAVTYAWDRTLADGSQPAPVGQGATYTPTASDVGHKLRCRVTATDGGGTAERQTELTQAPFDNGRVVRPYCDGRPAGTRDECGDFDGDGTANRSDDDRDGDGTPGHLDADDFDARTPAAEPAPAPPTPTPTPTAPAPAPEVRGAAPVAEAGAPNGRFATANAVLESSSRTIRTRHGRAVVLTGTLVAPAGRAISGARLEVHAGLRVPGAIADRLRDVVTDAEGRYRIVVAAGASRTVRVGYRARLGDTEYARTSDVTVLVRAGLSFRLSRRAMRNGQTLRYLGRLRGPHTGHRFVEVQVRTGGRWIVVCSVRTDARGAYGCAHRFTRTRVPTRYRFRARVRRQSGLPYEPAATATRTVLVRP